MLGIFTWKGCQALEQTARGSAGVTSPEAFKPCGYDTWGHSLVVHVAVWG